MNYLLTGFVQKDARILMFNPGAEIGNFLNGARYLVSAAPHSMNGIPSGLVPADAQPLLTDERVLRFLDNPAVIKAAGGLSGSRHYVKSVGYCQINDPENPYHHHELTMTRHKDGFIRTCWHHDNILRAGDVHQQQADEILLHNQRAFVARSIFTDLRLPAGHLLNP
ncbi:cytoplasmic protein, partial [Morganella morganii]